MKRVKTPRDLGKLTKVSLPKDLHWKIFGKLVGDLGFSPNEIPGLFGAIRNRDEKSLREVISSLGYLSNRPSSGMASYDASQFFRLHQISGFLKKFPSKGTDSKKRAIEKFFLAETRCGRFNNENYKALISLSERHPDFLGIIEEVREDILSLLGPYPRLDSVLSHAAHGPGVSLGDLYEDGQSTEFFKWSQLPYSVTLGTLPYAREAIESDPRWIGALDDWYRNLHQIPIGAPINIEHFWSSVFNLVPGSRITTVPKTSEIDRTIAIEPLMNVYLQLGVDHIIKSLLKRWGCDLSSQKKNQDYAYIASCDNSMATIDLRMASDTIALMICALLLPEAWYDLLLDLRSPIGDCEGQEVPFEKISSMGNGYTFAIESLIFAALSRCAIRRTKSEKKFAVFGDDIIVPTSAFTYLVNLLNFCGFETNVDKTFVDGPFRESCGKDFYLGYDVRPVFLKKRLQTVRDLFYIHNAIVDLRDRLHWAWGFSFDETLALIQSYIPSKVKARFYGPKSESWDTHLFSEAPLPRDGQGFRFFEILFVKPHNYDHLGRYKMFFFRKLMSQLKPRAERKWLDPKKHLANSGNAFSITKRDHVALTCTRCIVQ